MTELEIKYVTKGGKSHETITELGGDHWRASSTDIIQAIKGNKNVYFTKNGSARAKVSVIQGQQGEYLRSQKDGTPNDNLLNLPAFPQVQAVLDAFAMDANGQHASGTLDWLIGSGVTDDLALEVVPLWENTIAAGPGGFNLRGRLWRLQTSVQATLPSPPAFGEKLQVYLDMWQEEDAPYCQLYVVSEAAPAFQDEHAYLLLARIQRPVGSVAIARENIHDARVRLRSLAELTQLFEQRMTTLEGTVAGHTTALQSLGQRMTTVEGTVAGHTTALQSLGQRMTTVEGTVAGHTTTLGSHWTAIAARALANHTHDYAPVNHTHDYAPANHTHDYAPANHTHNYAPADHTHNYAPADHTHNYAPATHTHDYSNSEFTVRSLTLANNGPQAKFEVNPDGSLWITAANEDAAWFVLDNGNWKWFSNYRWGSCA